MHPSDFTHFFRFCALWRSHPSLKLSGVLILIPAILKQERWKSKGKVPGLFWVYLDALGLIGAGYGDFPFIAFDPAQKRTQAPDSFRGEIKILDSCSTSQIHLWSKSQI